MKKSFLRKKNTRSSMRYYGTAVIAIALLVLCVCVGIFYARYIVNDSSNSFVLKTTAKYRMTFDPNGGEIASPSSSGGVWFDVSTASVAKMVEVGLPYGELPVAEKTGYTFTEWVTPGLPEGFHEVEYIENKNNAYIATGIMGGLDTYGCEIKLQSTLPKDANGYFCLNSNQVGQSGVMQFANDGIGFIYYINGTNNTRKAKLGDVVNGVYEVSNYQGNVTSNGEKIIEIQNDATRLTSSELCLFHAGVGLDFPGTGRIYYCCFYSDLSFTEKIREFIPAIWDGGETECRYRNEKSIKNLPANTAGLYDTVEKVFYINSGSGNLYPGKETGAGHGTRSITEDSIVTAAKDQIAYAKWVPNQYTVTLDFDDGITPTATMSVIYDETFKELPNPKRTGYTFDGWFDEQNNKYEPDDRVRITDDIKLTAGWQSNKYTINFNVGKGTPSEFEPKEVEFGKPYGELPHPKLTGYTLEGWTVSGLPAGYQEVEYIENVSNAYIETGLKGGLDTYGCEIKLKSSAPPTGYFALNSNQTGQCGVMQFENEGMVFVYYDAQKAVHHISLGAEHTAEYSVSNKNRIITSNGAVVGTMPEVTTKLTNSGLYFFIGGYGKEYTYQGRGRIYYCRLYDDLSFSNLVRNFIPAVWNGGTTTYYRDGKQETGDLPENTAGLYDTVNDVFHINSGTGTLSHGNPIEHPEEVITESSIVNTLYDHTLTAVWEPIEYTIEYYSPRVLGENLQQLEYVESTGDTGRQSLDTGLTKDQIGSVEIELMWMKTVNTWQVNGLSNDAQMGISKDGYWHNWDGSTVQSKLHTWYDVRLELDHDDDISTLYVRESSHRDLPFEEVDSHAFGTNDNSFRIFSTDGNMYYCNERVKRVRIDDPDGKLIMDLIPCYDTETEKAGMYDLVSKSPVDNSRITGELQAGDPSHEHDLMYSRTAKYDEEIHLQDEPIIMPSELALTGWNTAEDGSGDTIAKTAVVSKLTSEDGGTFRLYALWSLNKYTIRFVPNLAAYSDEQYSELEYIKSNGSQTLDTGLVKADIGRVDMELLWNRLTSGYQMNGLNNDMQMGIAASGYWHNRETSSIKAELNTWYDVRLDVNHTDKSAALKVRAAGSAEEYELAKNSAWGSNDAGHFCIFSVDGGSFKSYEQVHKVTMYAVDGTTVLRDMVPCINMIDDSLGFYDRENDEFYTSIGLETDLKSQEIEYGKGQTLNPNTYTRSGYTFTGWNTKPDGSGTAYSDGASTDTITSSGKTMYLYAQWEETKNKLTLNYNDTSGRKLDVEPESQK